MLPWLGLAGKELAVSSVAQGQFGHEVLTDETLPEVVGLSLIGLVPRELPVNLILDVGHGDESSDHTTPATRFHCCNILTSGTHFQTL